MGELSEVPVSSPACYTIDDDDDEPEVIIISDNLSEENSRDGEEPSSTTSDINGDNETQGDNGSVGDSDEYADAGTQREMSESSDSSDEDEGSGNVLNDFIKLIDVVKSYEQVDKTVKTKFKDGFLFLENLQTQFEDTERNISEKDELIAELITENNKLHGDNKQLKGEMSTQSIQLGMLRNKYVKLEDELERLKISEKIAEETSVIAMPKNLSLEAMKSKADKLQQLFRQLCSKMSEEKVDKSDPESVMRSKELKSFQNEVGVLFIKVQHKLSKWVKNQVNMEEELERCRLSLEQLHDMFTVTAKLIPSNETQEMKSTTATFGSPMEIVAPPPTIAVVESSSSQPVKKRKLPPPQLVPLNIPSISRCNRDTLVTPTQCQNNKIPSVPLPSKLPKTSFNSPASESGTNSDDTSGTLTTGVKTVSGLIPSPSPTVPVQPSPPQALPMPSSAPPSVLKIKTSLPPAAAMQPAPLPAVPMQSSSSLVSKSSSPPLENRTSDTSRISPLKPSPNLYQLPPLPTLNFPLSPRKPIVSTPTPTSSSEQVVNTVCTVSSSSVKPKSPKVQQPEAKPKVKRRRAKTIRTTPPQYQYPPITSEESRYPIAPQYSQAYFPVHHQYNHNPYPLSQYTPNGPHQATLQAYKNQMMMQIPCSTASQCLPQQQHQISSSAPAPPVSTQSSIPPVSAPETQKPTPQNKCQVCAMAFLTPIQLKLHHAVIHSNKTPSSKLTGPAATSPPTSSTSPSSSSYQQNLSRPLLVPPPPLQDRHQNAASLQRVSSIRQIAVSTNTNIGTPTTTTTWSNESNQKRHCMGLSPLTSSMPTSSIPNYTMNKFVNSTLPSGNNNVFSWFDLF